MQLSIILPKPPSGGPRCACSRVQTLARQSSACTDSSSFLLLWGSWLSAHAFADYSACPEQCFEVGTVTAHGVWNTKQALARAGIPADTDGSQYPLPYRILVPPEFRERAVAVLREIEQRPLSVGYGLHTNRPPAVQNL